MANAQLSILLTDLRKRIGNVVFSKWKETNYVRQYVKQAAGNSEEQQRIRANFKLIVTVWKSLCDGMRSTWENAAKTLNMTGYNLFIKENAVRLIAGTPMEVANASADVPTLFTLAAAPAGSGSIQCSFELPTGSETKYLILAVQKMTGDEPTGTVSLVNGGVNPVSPYTISGLEPGMNYTVHAMLADNEYAAAVSVSGSLSAVSAAGA